MHEGCSSGERRPELTRRRPLSCCSAVWTAAAPSNRTCSSISTARLHVRCCSRSYARRRRRHTKIDFDEYLHVAAVASCFSSRLANATYSMISSMVCMLGDSFTKIISPKGNINQKYTLFQVKAAAVTQAEKNPGEVHHSFRRSFLVLVYLFLIVWSFVGSKL